MLMRTTLTVDDDIMMTARRQAAREGRPLKDIISEALRLGLGEMRQQPAGTRPFALTLVDGRGLLPGVRLDDRDALFDLLDGRR